MSINSWYIKSWKNHFSDILNNHFTMHPLEMMSENHTLIAEIYALTVKDLMQPLDSKDSCLEKTDDIEQVFLLLSKKNHIWVISDRATLELAGVITQSDTISLFAPVVTSLESFDKPSLQSFQYGLSTKVSEIMSTLPITATTEDKISDVISKMKQQKVKQLPVVDENNRLIGEITLTHLINEYLQRSRKSK